MKDIKLNRTQLFLRFLKLHHLYNDYLKEMHENGKSSLADAYDKAKLAGTNDILAFIGFSMNEMFWTNMMNWPNDSSYYFNNLHDKQFWNIIDGKWTRRWSRFRDKFQAKPHDTICQLDYKTFNEKFIND